jgi:hypothetical protein
MVAVDLCKKAKKQEINKSRRGGIFCDLILTPMYNRIWPPAIKKGSLLSCPSIKRILPINVLT